MSNELFSKPGQLLVIDPGETVGWAWFSKTDDSIVLKSHGQHYWKDFLMIFYQRAHILTQFNVLIEDYRIRIDTVSANLGKELLTPKILGVVEFLCKVYNKPLSIQPPSSQAKQFFSKKRLKDWGFWAVGKQHSRSAIRHGLYYYKFGEGKDE